MEYRILGSLDVRDDDGPVPLGGPKPRALLAMLLLHANEPVSADRLAIALWGGDAPAGAAKTIHVYVSRLRRALGDPAALATTPGGYQLRVLPGELDAERFAQLAADGHRAVPEHAARARRWRCGAARRSRRMVVTASAPRACSAPRARWGRSGIPT